MLTSFLTISHSYLKMSTPSPLLVAPLPLPLPMPLPQPLQTTQDNQSQVEQIFGRSVRCMFASAIQSPSPPGSGHECLPVPPPPNFDDEINSNANVVEGVFLHQEQGPRDFQEDTMVAFSFENLKIVGLFDGHGGRDAAYFCSEHLPTVYRKFATQYSTQTEILYHTIRTLERDFLPQTPVSPLLTSHISGCTLEIVVLDSRERKLYMAHMGDSRVLLIRKDASFDQLSTDHIWTNAAEKLRVTQMHSAHVGIIGRRIVRTTKSGVHGQFVSLEVSRAFGDPFFKPWVSGEPEITVTNLDDSALAIVLNSDGVNHVFTNADIATCVCNHSKHPVEAIRHLVNEKIAQNSGDNCSIAVLML